jgi:hypothetical protein
VAFLVVKLWRILWWICWVSTVVNIINSLILTTRQDALASIFSKFQTFFVVDLVKCWILPVSSNKSRKTWSTIQSKSIWNESQQTESFTFTLFLFQIFSQSTFSSPRAFRSLPIHCKCKTSFHTFMMPS